MDGVEIPRYFLCPISLQIMKDPVITVTGITYDRENIERWLASHNTKICPLTNQPLPHNSDLTPNHTLRRLIQTWCTFNTANGVDRIPTPRAPASHGTVVELLEDMSNPRLISVAMNAIEKIASGGERDRMTLRRAGVGCRMVSLIISNHEKSQTTVDFDSTDIVSHAVNILTLIRAWSEEEEGHDFDPDLPVNSVVVESMTWVLKNGRSHELRSQAVQLLRSLLQLTVGNGNSNGNGNGNRNSNGKLSGKRIMERLKPELFEAVVQVLRDRISPQTTKTALQLLLLACPYGRNKVNIIESGGVAEIIEIGLMVVASDKRTSELNLSILNHLCSCAEGREQFLSHKTSIAMTTKLLLKVSPVVDEMAIGILASIGKHSASYGVLHEMLKVGGVSKLCMVLQADYSWSVKQKARFVLNLHSEAWRDSPSISP